MNQISEMQQQMDAYEAEVARLTAAMEQSEQGADKLNVKISQVGTVL